MGSCPDTDIDPTVFIQTALEIGPENSCYHNQSNTKLKPNWLLAFSRL